MEKNEKSKLSPSQDAAIRKYLAKFVEMRMRVTPDEQAKIKAHLAVTGESANVFLRRAVSETMERDCQK